MRDTGDVSFWSRHLRGLLLVIVLAASGTFIASCASERINLVDQGAVQVQAEPSDAFEIRNIRVLSEPDESTTIVYGQVRRIGVYNNAFVGGYILVHATFPDGRVVEKLDNILIPIHRPRNFRPIYPKANFKVRFDQVIPSGTLLYITFVA